MLSTIKTSVQIRVTFQGITFLGIKALPDHRYRLPGVVDEQLLAGTVLLAHHHVQLALPGPLVLA